MKKIMKLTSIVIAFSLALSFFGNTHTLKDVNASTSTRVTATEKRNIKKLCSNFTTFLGLELTDPDSATNYFEDESVTWEFQKWNKEDMTYKENMIVPLWYMYCKDPAKKVFDIDSWIITTKEGDWGEAAPVMSLRSIKKVSSKKYKVNYNINWESSFPKKSVTKIGSATFTLKKKRGTYYGFVVKSVVIKKVANQIILTQKSPA